MSASQEQFAIGIDIGATKIASVLLSERGAVLASSQVLTRAEDGMQAVFDKVASQIQGLIPQSPGKLAGLGIGSPGKVDSIHGKVYNAINLGWAEVSLVTEICSRIGRDLPVWIQKDAN